MNKDEKRLKYNDKMLRDFGIVYEKSNFKNTIIGWNDIGVLKAEMERLLLKILNFSDKIKNEISCEKRVIIANTTVADNLNREYAVIISIDFSTSEISIVASDSVADIFARRHPEFEVVWGKFWGDATIRTYERLFIIFNKFHRDLKSTFTNTK